MEEKIELLATKEKRIDQLLAEALPKYSRSYFQFLITKNSIFCNGQVVKKRTIPKIGDKITLILIDLPKIQLEKQAISLNILYEDQDLLVINKPRGLVVHPAPGNPSGTLVNGLLHHCESLSDNGLRPGIVHRLDKDTSGVIVAAKNTSIHQALVQEFATRNVWKKYLAITVGKPKMDRICAPIVRNPRDRKTMTIGEGGKTATTKVTVLSSDGHVHLILAEPITGRTHQIRVHLRYAGSPIVGDETYGVKHWNKKLEVQGQLLHAYSLSLIHPVTKKRMEWKAPIPENFYLFPNLMDSFIHISP